MKYIILLIVTLSILSGCHKESTCMICTQTKTEKTDTGMFLRKTQTFTACEEFLQSINGKEYKVYEGDVDTMKTYIISTSCK